MARPGAAIRRSRTLWRRYREDGRLPGHVVDLYASAARRRVAGARRLPGGPTAGPLTASLDTIAHDNAGRVLGALDAAHVPAWLVDREGDALVVGVSLERRADAARAIGALGGTPGWAVRWSRGRRAGTVQLNGGAPASLLTATNWNVFRRFQFGTATVGADQGVIVGFWAPGQSGQNELVGVRGLERFPIDSPPEAQVVDGRTYPGRASFPVGRALERLHEPVDVVYTWVDGADPAWRADFDTWAARAGREPRHDVNIAEGRYRSRDELRYSLRSLATYCGWVRHVWVVTAGQVPDWLRADDRLTVVDHREIIDARHLPTFNSHVIESCLHHIDGLAERFLYLNDDMFIGRSLRPEAFFTPSGLPYVFDSRSRVLTGESAATLAVDTAARRNREALAARYGRVATFKPLHAPYPLLRSTLAELELDFPGEFERTRAARFRSPTDLSTAASLALHAGLATGRATPGTLGNEYVHLESPRLRLHLDRLLHERRFDTFCLNETEQPCPDPAAVDRAVGGFLAAYFPVPSPWETGGPDA